MSELKPFKYKTTHINIPVELEVYLKSEADKVIAELNRQIEFLKVTTDSCKDCNRCADGMGKVFNKELDPLKDKLRYAKYKRCLAMAEKCHALYDKYSMLAADDANWEVEDYYFARWRFFEKWKYKWLKLAEKFNRMPIPSAPKEDENG